MSERNTDAVGEAHCPSVDYNAGPVGLTSSTPECFFGSPLQASGDAQRDVREHASSSELDLPAVDREAGIEEEIATYVDLTASGGAHVPLQLETRGITSQKKPPLQKELWRRQTIHKFALAAKLREAGRADVADNLERCHTEITWQTCKGCSKHTKFLNRCERFYCPECQPTLSRDREKSVGWWAEQMKQPKHVVLTLKNFPRINKRVVLWAKEAFSRLRRRKFAKNWVGGFYNWEVTNEGNGWHLHVHALVEARWIDSGVLAAEWAKVTRGLGRIVKVMDARRHSYLKEVTKYAVKGNQLAAWSGDQILMFIDAFTGVRTFGVFGSLYGKRTEWREWIEQLHLKACTCECGCSDFWYRSDAEWQMSDVTIISDGPTRGPTTSNVAQLQFSTL